MIEYADVSTVECTDDYCRWTIGYHGKNIVCRISDDAIDTHIPGADNLKKAVQDNFELIQDMAVRKIVIGPFEPDGSIAIYADEWNNLKPDQG